MKVIAVPSVERLRATSDLELKLVVTMEVGMGSVLTNVPTGVNWSRKMGDVTPKLPSMRLLLKTLLVLVVDAYAPLSVALTVAQAAVEGQTGGRGWPTASVAAYDDITSGESVEGLREGRNAEAEREEYPANGWS
jgi:hypothetical protein